MKKIIKRLSIVLLCAILIATAGIIALSSDKDIKISDDYRFKAKSEMQGYIDTVNSRNAELVEEGLTNVPATVTFSKAMTKEDLEKFVASYDIDILELQARKYDSNGNRATIMSRVDQGLDETFSLIELMGQSRGGVYVGVIGLNIVTNSETVAEIQKDDDVLLIDTSTDRYHISGRTSRSRNTSNSLFKEEDSGYSFANSLAWQAEDLGLVNYAKN